MEAEPSAEGASRIGIAGRSISRLPVRLATAAEASTSRRCSIASCSVSATSYETPKTPETAARRRPTPEPDHDLARRRTRLLAPAGLARASVSEGTERQLGVTRDQPALRQEAEGWRQSSSGKPSASGSNSQQCATSQRRCAAMADLQRGGTGQPARAPVRPRAARARRACVLRRPTNVGGRW